MSKKKKPTPPEFTNVEIGESVSIDKNKIPQYPKKACIQFNDHFYYLYYLYDKLVVERVSFDEVYL